MTLFAQKLDTLPQTIELVKQGPIRQVAKALRAGRGKTAIAIGSGGSVVVAEYFRRCRATLGIGLTIVQTPMEFVLSPVIGIDCEVWLFSAGADNPDISAAFSMALKSGSAAIRLVTARENGITAREAASSDRADVFVLPVAELKDGFLATHSMVTMVATLLYACDTLCELPSGHPLHSYFLDSATKAVKSRNANALVSNFHQGDTVLVLHDPQVKPLVALIETSLWETGIGPVQQTDFRNFAHGRHVWAAKYPDRMFLLALTAAESRDVWLPIARALPSSIRTGKLDLGHAGRLRLALAIVEGLLLVEAMGVIMKIDPAKPGRGSFAEPIYESTALADVAVGLTSAVLHKIRAIQEHDELICPDGAASTAGKRHLAQLRDGIFKGLVLDYDGTIVSTDSRLSPPDGRILTHLTRLIDDGIRVAFATGRGGSVGEVLRDVLPIRTHPLVIVGYYNGGHVRTLDVDIRSDPPIENEALQRVAKWVEQSGLLKPDVNVKRGNIQITLNHSDIADPTEFQRRMMLCPAMADGTVRLVRSHHSFDLLTKASNKRTVLDEIRRELDQADATLLCIGDSASPAGNDRDLLSGGIGVSVDSVCGAIDGSWSLFGCETTGPAALLQVLEALEVRDGTAILNLPKLLDVG